MSEDYSSPSSDPTFYPSRSSKTAHERQPLLSREDTNRIYGSNIQEDGCRVSSSTTFTSPTSIQAAITSSERSRSRWTSLIFIVISAFTVIVIFFCVSMAPASVETYARNALSIEPTKLSIESFTNNGIKARIQADLTFDAAKVSDTQARVLGKFAAWLVRKVESEPAKLNVVLPDFGDKPIALAKVPRIVVDIRNHHTTSLDFIFDLILEDTDEIRKVFNDWLERRLDQIRIYVNGNVGLKSWLVPLGNQPISNLMFIEGDKIPSIPSLQVRSIQVQEVSVPESQVHGLAACISVFVKSIYPFELDLPPLGFEILAHGCETSLIQLTEAFTSPTHFYPKSGAILNISATVQDLPKIIFEYCPRTNLSPLDMLLTDYVHGKNVSLFIRGLKSSSTHRPKWIKDIISNIILPISVPSHQLNSSIKNFSVIDTQIRLPDAFAEPGTDESYPHLSGHIIAIVDMPKEMKFSLGVKRVRAFVKILYRERIFGTLNLRKWQSAKSDLFQRSDGSGQFIKVESFIEDAPLMITDENVFTELIQNLLINRGTILLQVDALVDVELFTFLGEVVVNDIPAKGTIPIKV